MRRKLELLKLQIKSAFLSIPKIILGTIVTAVLVIAISTCIGIATAQDSDMRMKVAVVYPDYDETENSDSADDNKEFRYIKMAFNYVSEIDTIKNVCTFEYTDRQQAIDGLRNNYYVMAIIVPENMISDIMSGENTPVEVVCQSEGVNNTSMIFREMVRAGGSDLATAEAGIYTFDDLFNGVLKNYRGLRGTHENKLNDIYLSYALNRSIYFKTRDISVKEGLSTVQFYVCTAIVMLLLLSTITCAGNMKGESRSLAKSLKGAGISAFDTGIARTTGVGIVYIMIFEVLFIIINVMRLGVPAISGVLAVSTVGEFIASILGIVVLVYAAVSFINCIFSVVDDTVYSVITVCILGMACMYASGCIVSSAFLAPGVRVIGMYLPTNGLFTLACQIIKGTVDISTIMTNVMWIIIFQAAGALAVKIRRDR